jgi:hypothetical protein
VRGEIDMTFDEFVALSPNERAEIMQAGVIRDWNQLPADQHAEIRARAVELRQRRADA